MILPSEDCGQWGSSASHLTWFRAPHLQDALSVQAVFLQLDSLLRSLGFSQKKADSQIRWAVLNTVTLLRRHEKAHKALVGAMIAGKSVGDCIAIIEDELKDVPDV